MNWHDETLIILVTFTWYWQKMFLLYCNREPVEKTHKKNTGFTKIVPAHMKYESKDMYIKWYVCVKRGTWTFIMKKISSVTIKIK